MPAAPLRTPAISPRPSRPYRWTSNLAELNGFITAHDAFRQDGVIPAIGRGTASREVVRRVALEFYYLARWITPELALLIANAPDAYAFTMDDSRHYRRWAQHFAGQTGYLRGPNHLQVRVDVCRQLGLTDDDIRGYTPLAETIATTFTMLYYARRSYEEGLAVFGYAGERLAAGGHARTFDEGLERHYGVRVGSSRVDADGGPDRDNEAADLFRWAATTRTVQDRCREAIRNYLLVAGTRVRTMNRWVE